MTGGPFGEVPADRCRSGGGVGAGCRLGRAVGGASASARSAVLSGLWGGSGPVGSWPGPGDPGRPGGPAVSAATPYALLGLQGHARATGGGTLAAAGRCGRCNRGRTGDSRSGHGPPPDRRPLGPGRGHGPWVAAGVRRTVGGSTPALHRRSGRARGRPGDAGCSGFDVRRRRFGGCGRPSGGRNEVAAHAHGVAVGVRWEGDRREAADLVFYRYLINTGRPWAGSEGAGSLDRVRRDAAGSVRDVRWVAYVTE